MIKSLYNKNKYLFNMLMVLMLIIFIRILDWSAWTPGNLKMILLEHFFEFVSFMPVLFLMITGYRWALKKDSRSILYVFIILFVLGGPILSLCLSTWLEMLIIGKNVLPLTIQVLARYAPGLSLIIIFMSSAYYLTYLIEQAGKQRETAYKAETLAKDVQLKMLRYQINPHFLFNVLNSIYTLIDENTEKAKKLVIDMSEYYRYTLNKQQQTIPIEKEIDSILKYLEIQKTRFEEEFHYEISVDEHARQILIPTFLIHLLVENSVKYGTKTEKQKLIINLNIRLTGKNLLITVANTGKLNNSNPTGEKSSNGTGNGIENLKYRLSLYYNENSEFTLKEENGWVIASIEISNINIT